MLRVRVQTVRFPAVLPESMRNPLEPAVGRAAHSTCESLGQKLLFLCPFLQAAAQWRRCRQRFPPAELRVSRRASAPLSPLAPPPTASRSHLGPPLLEI